MRGLKMLAHPTVEQLHQLGLAGMARAFAELEANPTSAALSHAEWLGLLLDREITERYERRLRARLRFARLRHQAAVEDVDYRAARGLDRTLFQTLIAGRWIDAAQNLVIEGPAGVGKSWLACALGHKACRDNRSVLYQRVPKLFTDLALARGDGRYPRLMRALGGVKLLILDDWGSRTARPRAAPRHARNRRRPLRPRRHPDHQPNPSGPLACPDRGCHLGRRHLGSRHSQCPSPAAQRRQFAQAKGAANRRCLTASTAYGEITSVQRALRHPGRHHSERPADFDRNRWPTSIGMPGRHHRNPQHGPLDPEMVALDPLLQVLGDVMPRLVWQEPVFPGRHDG